MLDTNALIWWLRDDPALGPRARSLISSPSNIVLVSIASPWEMSIKARIGKLDMCGSDAVARIADEKMQLIQLSAEHLLTLETLPMHHRDPFDHLIIAQAKVEGVPIITSDAQMTAYGVPCIGVD